MFTIGYLRHLHDRIRAFCTNRRAATALIFALSAAPLLVAAGGAVDFTRYYDTQQSVQAALDAAVLAGAAADNSDNIATQAFNSWPVKFSGTLDSPGFTASETDEASYYAGNVNAHLDMYFAQIAGIKKLSFTITSKAVRLKTTDGSDGTPCAWIGKGGMQMGGSGRFLAPNCQMDIRGGDPDFATGSRIMTPRLCMAHGLKPVYDGKIYTPDQGSPVVENCPAPVSYSLPPHPSYSGCDHPARIDYRYASYNSLTLKPGTFCGGLHFQGGPDSDHPMQVTLAPGLYILSGSPFEFEGYISLYGYGVTFYFIDANSWLKFDDDNTTSELSAPTSGDCETDDRCGVLMFEPSGLDQSSPAGFSYGTSHAWTGNILLPSRWIGHNDNACNHDHHMDLYGRMAVYGVHVCGDSRWRVWPRKTVRREACPTPRPEWWPLYSGATKVCTPANPLSRLTGNAQQSCKTTGSVFANLWWYSWWHYWRHDYADPRTGFACTCPGPEGPKWTYGRFPDGTAYSPASWHNGRYAYPAQAPWPYHRPCACHSENWHPWHKICEDDDGNYDGGGDDETAETTYSTPHLVE